MSILWVVLLAVEESGLRYEHISYDNYFTVSYRLGLGLKYENDQFYKGPNVPYVDIVNPNLKGLRKMIRRLFYAVLTKDLAKFKVHLSKRFRFYAEFRDKTYLNSIGVYSLMPVFMLEIPSSGDVYGRGLDGIRKMFEYIPKEVLLAIFSGGYYVTLHYEEFENEFGKWEYGEILSRLRDSEIDLDKGTEWMSKQKLQKIFSKVYLPYFWNNIYIPEKVKKAPVSLETPYHFLPPPVRVYIKWDPKEKRWLLNSFTYGWPEIDW